MRLLEGFLLGLSTGTYCVMSCYPLILPVLMSSLDGHKANAKRVSLFVAGRFFSYILVGALIGMAGWYAQGFIPPDAQIIMKRISWLFAGTILVVGGIWTNFPRLKLCQTLPALWNAAHQSLELGVLAGLNLCPPFLAAGARIFALPAGSSAGAALSGALYFFCFFLGTTVFLLPLFGTGFLGTNGAGKAKATIQNTARIIMLLLGCYFFFFEGIVYFMNRG